MANNHTKIFNIISHWEIQIKTTGYHYKSIIMDKIKIAIISKSGKHAQKLDHSDIIGGSVKLYSPFGKLFDSFL